MIGGGDRTTFCVFGDVRNSDDSVFVYMLVLLVIASSPKNGLFFGVHQGDYHRFPQLINLVVF